MHSGMVLLQHSSVKGGYLSLTTLPPLHMIKIEGSPFLISPRTFLILNGSLSFHFSWFAFMIYESMCSFMQNSSHCSLRLYVQQEQHMFHKLLTLDTLQHSFSLCSILVRNTSNFVNFMSSLLKIYLKNFVSSNLGILIFSDITSSTA